MSKHTTAGIDFGNQNCVFSLPAKNGIDIISNQSSNRKTPTMINIFDERRFGGEFAQQQQLMNVSGTITHIKELIGLNYNSQERENLSQKLPYKLVPLEGSNLTGIQLENEKIFYPEQILAYLLKCCFDILKMKDKNIDQIVLTVSPWMNENQRQIILDAASIANIKIASLLDSATAAAISYVKIHDSRFPSKKEDATNAVLIDFGDVSFNVSVAKLSKKSVEILSCVSDKTIGGSYFTDLLQEYLLTKVEEKYAINPRNNKRAMLRFNQAVEKVKKTLSTNSIFILEVASLMNDIDISIPVKREEFVNLIKNDLYKISDTLELALKNAKITKESIANIEILGGSSRIPCVKQQIKDFFGKDPMMSLDLDECFAIGAGYMASKLDGNDIGIDVINNALPYQISYDSECIEDCNENFVDEPSKVEEDQAENENKEKDIELTEHSDNQNTESLEDKVDADETIETNNEPIESAQHHELNQCNDWKVQLEEQNKYAENNDEQDELINSVEQQVAESNESTEQNAESSEKIEAESNEQAESNTETADDIESVEVEVNEIQPELNDSTSKEEEKEDRQPDETQKVEEIVSEEESQQAGNCSPSVEKDEELLDPKVLFKPYTNLPNTATFALPIKQLGSFELQCNDTIIGEGVIETNIENMVEVNIIVSIDDFGIISIDSASYSINGDETIDANFSFNRFNTLSKEMISNFAKIEEDMQLNDKKELEIDEIKNDLEREFFATHNLVRSFENTEEQNKFTAIREWFEENEFERLSIEEYQTKLKALKEIQKEIQKEIDTEKKIKDIQQQLKGLNEKLINCQKAVTEDQERMKFKESIELQSDIEKIGQEIQNVETNEQILNVDLETLSKNIDEIEKRSKELKQIPLPQKKVPLQQKNYFNNSQKRRVNRSDQLAETWSPFTRMQNGRFGMWDDPWSIPKNSVINDENESDNEENEEMLAEQIKAQQINEEIEQRKRMQQEIEERKRQQIELEKQRRIREAEERRRYIEMKQKEEMLRQQQLQEEQQRAAAMQRRQRNRFDPWLSYNPQSSYNTRTQNPFYQPRQQRISPGYPFGW